MIASYGAPGRDSELAVPGHHFDPVPVARCDQGCLGAAGDLRVDVYRDDPALAAGDLGQQRGVVTAAADFENFHARLDACLRDHPGLQPRRADRGQVSTVLIGLGDRRQVRSVSVGQGGTGQHELMPWHGAEGCLGNRRRNPPLCDEFVCHRVP